MATPAAADGSIAPEVLIAARVAGVHRIFKMGGAHAVAALAYGTQSVPRVDKIVGPGNVYVAAAANDAQRGSPAAYPAAFDGLVLAAGSMRLTRHDGRFLVELSDFSNTNAYVDFVCPGEDVWTFLPTRTARRFRRIYRSAIRAGVVRVERASCKGKTQWLVELDGTSFASPALAAMVAGLMQQLMQENDGRLPTTADVRRALVERSERFVDPTGRTWLVPTLLARGDGIGPNRTQ